MLHSVSKLHPSKLSFDIKVRWRAALMAHKSWSSPFLTPEYAQSVGKEREDACLIIARDHQGLIGILGVHIGIGGFARPLGAPISDHQAFITEPGFEAPLDEVLKAAGIGALSFTGLNDPQDCLVSEKTSTSVSHLIDLAGGADHYFAEQGKANAKHFKKMRQRARGAIRDHGTMELVLDSQDQAGFDLLMKWKKDQYRRTRKCDVLASSWIFALLKRLWNQKGRVRAVLNVLYLGGKPAAAEIGLYCNGTYHSWIAAYDPSLSRCSPGLLLLEGIIRQSGCLGIAQIDIGSGHDHYKKYYANAEAVLIKGIILGEGFAAHQHRLIDQYGTRMLAGIPARLAGSIDFIGACHPGWQGMIRGFAGRLTQLAG